MAIMPRTLSAASPQGVQQARPIICQPPSMCVQAVASVAPPKLSVTLQPSSPCVLTQTRLASPPLAPSLSECVTWPTLYAHLRLTAAGMQPGRQLQVAPQAIHITGRSQTSSSRWSQGESVQYARLQPEQTTLHAWCPTSSSRYCCVEWLSRVICLSWELRALSERLLTRSCSAGNGQGLQVVAAGRADVSWAG